MRALAVLLAVAVGAALLATAAAAETTASCGKQVVADWYDNGRIDRLYKLACYREAIRIIPVDVRDYSNAIEEITRALQYAKRGKRAPAKPTRPRSSGTGPNQVTTSGPGIGTSKTDTGKTGTGKKGTKTTTTRTATTDTGTGSTGAGGGVFTDAGGNIDTSGPSSVPVPLIVLGGLALLLLAAGSAGYISRRLNGRRGNGDGPPPSSA